MTAHGFYRPRCKRRDCPRCWVLRSRETARALVLDAREDAPRYCMTLTTFDPNTEAATIRRGVRSVVQRLRRRYGRVEYFAAVEFTTGKAHRSGGHRRLHLHVLLKAEGIDVLEAEQLVRQTWEGATAAHVVEFAELVSPGAALGYLALHHRKPSQAPPPAWRGMTERPSKGYFSRPVSELRARAKLELAAEAIAHRTGIPLELALIEVANRERPRLIEVRPLGGVSPVLEPVRELHR